jgi:hypothetical protein
MNRPKRGLALLMVLVSLLSVPAEFVFAQARPPECSQKCVRGVDTAACSDSSGIGSGKNCRETSECTVHAVDADGAGPGAPIITVTCTYSCSIEYCYWV